jgi:hypothetical protein
MLLQALPALIVDERRSEATLRAAATQVGRLAMPDVASSLDPRKLPLLAEAAESSLVRLEALRSMLESGQGSFASFGEQQAFYLLLSELRVAAPTLRQAAATASTTTTPAPIPTPTEATHGWWPWLLGLALAMAAWFAWRRRQPQNEAHRFVREVFEA